MDVLGTPRVALLVILMAVAGLGISACYPRPHRFIENPEVTGVLLRDGLPVHGARVLIAHTRGDDGNYCRDGRVVAVTSENGAFHVEASAELHVFTSLLNPPQYVAKMSSVCFDLPAQTQLGVLLLAPTDRKTSYALSCDLGSQPREFKQGVIWPKDKWGICQNAGGPEAGST